MQLMIDKEGFANKATQIASPNCDARQSGCGISLIVIHNISLPPQQYGSNGIVELFTNQLNPKEHPYYEEIHLLKVSSHFLIRRNGELVQFVSCLARAWHAGVSSWKGVEQCNDFSIGIELEGSDFDPFENPQYQTLKTLVNTLKMTYHIDDVVGHSDIAPSRKTDPGPYFDWIKLK